MDAIQGIRQGLDFIHRSFRSAADGLSDEQLHWSPEGESHSIAWILWHAARIEDLFVHQVFQGKPAEWDTGGWAAKTGLPERGFGTGQPTAEAKAVRIANLDAFAQYAAKVADLADELVAGLTEDDLNREVKLGERTETLGQSITLHLITHLNGHRGEINILRGMMGLQPVLPNQGG
ncbi:MAG TPA: DinB family protein [Dehalococcoidia bacterium]|nr:DinB family protein [Dehalococcoidia bacterium]